MSRREVSLGSGAESSEKTICKSEGSHSRIILAPSKVTLYEISRNEISLEMGEGLLESDSENSTTLGIARVNVQLKLAVVS